MKKMITVCLCLLLVAAMAATVYAAGTSFSVSASQKTLYRGDTVTLTVSASSGTPATNYGLKLVYDSSALELVGGNCSVPGALVNSFNNGFAFLFQEPTAYSGTVGTVTLKVKSNAPVGDYSVSGTASVKNGNEVLPASGCSVTLTVTCDHTYGAWTESGTGHQKVCSACGDVQTGTHAWDNGSPIKEADCKEGGQIRYTCTDCGANKTEDTPKTNEHTYGAWTESGTGHQKVCSVCGDVKTGSHAWDNGSPIKEANCKEGGQTRYTCTDCGANKTEDVPKTDVHKFSAWKKISDTEHKRTCSVCQKEETAAHSWNSGVVTQKPTCKKEGEKTFTCTGCGLTRTEKLDILTTHTYDHGCDTDCNVCGVTRTTTHKYSTAWSKDKTGHWHACTECKDKKDMASHTPGPEATETAAQTCTVCGYIIKAALGHTHSYAETWTADEEGHWYACSGCEEKGSFQAHDFENACDTDCSICAYTRKTSHSFGEEWQKDGENHWYVCSGCGEKAEVAAHVPGAEATATTAQVCTACGYELVPALGGEELPEAEEDSFPWWIVIVAAVVAIGGAAAFVILRKKK